MVSWGELLIILGITIIGALSVASGLDRGIKILSNINVAMAVIIMVFILLTGPTLTLRAVSSNPSASTPAHCPS